MFSRVLSAVVAVTLLLAAAPARASTPPDPAAEPTGVWPLSPEPEVVAGFDPPDDPWGAGHRGVDLAGMPGQAVLAATAGRVTFAGQLAGRGVVVVDHGETRTTYEPVTATVRVGDEVQAGGAIGRLTVPMSHCFPRACLHWGWLRGDTYLDPLELVGEGGEIRLLPLWRDVPFAPPTTLVPYAGWLRFAPLRAWLTRAGAPACTPCAAGRW
ncbi:M23 family metallopeptidase [Nocardioides sp. LHG3406-4]|uniref:M23 family metallopeptidase n=1 Tax=Nocardioides sp. LHG3406-4 TaxID=2804575 RepID=UPI003CEE70E1